ncbi:hypothetical protein [Marinomonas sp. PE14-40]|uniref:hypothetical protein n=1 Tax=Marinomonas sp. PE14-40 TaxID=3060621 RepID=UPI003F6733DE
MQEPKESKPKESKSKGRIIFNKWALLYLALLIVASVFYQNYTWRDANTKVYPFSGTNVNCYIGENANSYEMSLLSPNAKKLRIQESFEFSDCERLRRSFLEKASSIHSLPHEFVLRVEGDGEELYQAEKSYFLMLFCAAFVWAFTIAFIEQVGFFGRLIWRVICYLSSGIGKPKDRDR